MTWNTNSTTSIPGHDGRGGPPSQGGGPGIGGTQQGGRGFNQPQGRADVSVGQTITLTSTTGQYAVIGNASENGTASGSLVFTVSGNLTEGYTLSITGSVVIGTTTYTISTGSAEMNPSATTISGQGSTSPTGAFILQGTSRGSFVGSTASVSLDMQSGSTEYIVFLNGTIQG